MLIFAEKKNAVVFFCVCLEMKVMYYVSFRDATFLSQLEKFMFFT